MKNMCEVCEFSLGPDILLTEHCLAVLRLQYGRPERKKGHQQNIRLSDIGRAALITTNKMQVNISSSAFR